MGRDEPERPQQASTRGTGRSEDEHALERYRYLVRTAPPERIEEAHEEAFAKLTPEQRRMALEQLSQSVPEHEAARSDDPRSLARMATRAEMREPGTVERAFGGGRGGMGMGGMALPLLGSFATAFVGTLAAQALFADIADGGLIDSFGNEGDGGGDHASDGGGDPGGDLSGGDLSAGDLGGGDFGGDLGGGDFGF